MRITPWTVTVLHSTTDSLDKLEMLFAKLSGKQAKVKVYGTL